MTDDRSDTEVIVEQLTALLEKLDRIIDLLRSILVKRS
jgi:hypothetical protein